MNQNYYPKHECGVFGIFGHPNAADITYYGLYALQHRGQESAGIVTASEAGSRFKFHKGMGLVRQVFNNQRLKDIQGKRAIGHVRYSTTGSSNIENAQPIVVNYARGQLAVAHNGNLVNADILRAELEAHGSIFQTTSDSEIIVQLMAQPHDHNRENHLVSTLKKIQGAFSLVIMGEREIIGTRDPFGFRPLSIGKLDGAYVLSSETCAFDLINAEFIRDVEPGEIIVIDEDGLRSIKPFAKQDRRAMCIFEYVYFSRPDSTISNVNVSAARIRLGQELAKQHPAKADIVVPVPDSGNYAALGYAEQSGIPYTLAFVRNHYIGRTFIQPTQVIRDFNVRVKLNLIKSVVENKRVIVIDDSIVRGTTARSRVTHLRKAGAKEVHVRVSCPPHRFPCHYGIDFPDPKALIANQMTPQEITKFLGADSIGYLSLEGMIKACAPLNATQFCTACFTGEYPVPPPAQANKLILENRKSLTDAIMTKTDLHQEHLL